MTAKITANAAGDQLTLSVGTSNVLTLLAVIGDYADDTAAAAGGVPVGALYRTGSTLKVRVA